MKILIRGAGDLATGIASRLYGAGHQILMTEIEVPLTVRRTVALSRAVYEKKVQIEEMEGFLAEDGQSAQAVLERGGIAVMVDPEMECRKMVPAGCDRGCDPGEEESGDRYHGCPVCDRRRTGIYCREGLQLCGRDKTWTYAGKSHLERQRHP